MVCHAGAAIRSAAHVDRASPTARTHLKLVEMLGLYAQLALQKARTRRYELELYRADSVRHVLCQTRCAHSLLRGSASRGLTARPGDQFHAPGCNDRDAHLLQPSTRPRPGSVLIISWRHPLTAGTASPHLLDRAETSHVARCDGLVSVERQSTRPSACLLNEMPRAAARPDPSKHSPHTVIVEASPQHSGAFKGAAAAVLCTSQRDRLRAEFESKFVDRCSKR